jgi:hypothetical protein
MTQTSFKVFFYNLKLLYKEYDEVRRVRGNPSKDKHNRARSRAYKSRKRSEAAKRKLDAKKAQDELKQHLTVVKPKVEYRSDFSRFMENNEISRRREADYSTSESGVGTTQMAETPLAPLPPPPPPPSLYGVVRPKWSGQTKLPDVEVSVEHGGVQVHEYVPEEGEPYKVRLSRFRAANRRRLILHLEPLDISIVGEPGSTPPGD